MKSIQKYSVILLAIFLSCNQQAVLVDTGSSDYSIEVSLDSADFESALELQKYIKNSTGYQIPINEKADRKIHLQSNGAIPNSIAFKVDKDKSLAITGSDPQYLRYAVYDFLEEYLGILFLSPTYEVVPNREVLSLPSTLDKAYTPDISTRTVHSQLYYEHPYFAAKQKVTTEAFPRYNPGARVHTFHRLIPADKYLDKHPEYFALVNDRRQATQLCLTNPDVLALVIEGVDSLISLHPDREVISVSQDDNTLYCQCDQCSAIDLAEGSQSGTMIRFVNEVARAFPDRQISTLAYQYTRHAPKVTVPEPNVIVTLCSIECDRSAAISEKCPDFLDDLKEWSKLSDNIRIWDYTTQFTNYLAPFPNLHTLQPNVQLFRDNNAKWVFEQHSRQPSELFELRSYLLAKLLWNPEEDWKKIVSEFCEGYYGKGAPYVEQYINTVHDELQKDSDFFLFLYGDPSSGFQSFLSDSLLSEYKDLFDQAEAKVLDNPKHLAHVKSARLSTDYAILEACRANLSDRFSLLSPEQTEPSTTVIEALASFKESVDLQGILSMNEMNFTVKEYLDQFTKAILRAKAPNYAVAKEVTLGTSPKKYANEDPRVLTDGALGGSSFYSNWLGFEGNSMIATVDLGEAVDVDTISMAFLQVTNHLVFFPTEVEVWTAIDSAKFTYAGTIENQNPLHAGSKVNDVQEFMLAMRESKVRFVKIHAKNVSVVPDWHNGAGLNSWIFADEIVIH